MHTAPELGFVSSFLHNAREWHTDIERRVSTSQRTQWTQHNSYSECTTYFDRLTSFILLVITSEVCLQEKTSLKFKCSFNKVNCLLVFNQINWISHLCNFQLNVFPLLHYFLLVNWSSQTNIFKHIFQYVFMIFSSSYTFHEV